jgi:hypothetical protein
MLPVETGVDGASFDCSRLLQHLLIRTIEQVQAQDQFLLNNSVQRKKK